MTGDPFILSLWTFAHFSSLSLSSDYFCNEHLFLFSALEDPRTIFASCFRLCRSFSFIKTAPRVGTNTSMKKEEPIRKSLLLKTQRKQGHTSFPQSHFENPTLSRPPTHSFQPLWVQWTYTWFEIEGVPLKRESHFVVSVGISNLLLRLRLFHQNCDLLTWFYGSYNFLKPLSFGAEHLSK